MTLNPDVECSIGDFVKNVGDWLPVGTPEDWAKRIQQRRVVSRLTQSELAQRAGVSITTVYRAEQALPVRISSLRKISEALQTKLEQFVNEKPVLRPEEISHVSHRAVEAIWYAPIDRRRTIPANNTELMQDSAERTRLGRLGLIPMFVCYPNFVMPEGPGMTLLEMHGRYDRAINADIYRECIVQCQRGCARLQVLDDVIELAEGDFVGFVSKNLRWIEPAVLGEAAHFLWFGAVRLGRLPTFATKRTIVRKTRA